MRRMKPLLLGGKAQTYLGLAPLATLIKWEQLLGKEKDVSLTPLVGHEHDPPSGTLSLNGRQPWTWQFHMKSP